LLNGDAHQLEVEELRCIRPVANYQTDRAHDTRPRAALHRLMPSHRILYFGTDYGLLKSLTDALPDCLIVRCPDDYHARLFLKSDIKYSLLLFDETDAGAALEAYTRTLEHRERTPVMLIKQGENFRTLVDSISRVVSGK
jgi:hypothetical protein